MCIQSICVQKLNNNIGDSHAVRTQIKLVSGCQRSLLNKNTWEAKLQNWCLDCYMELVFSLYLQLATCSLYLRVTTVVNVLVYGSFWGEHVYPYIDWLAWFIFSFFAILLSYITTPKQNVKYNSAKNKIKFWNCRHNLCVCSL